MLKDLHITHLTGSGKVVKNQILTDQIQWGYPRRTMGQMFFKPYESKKEFIFCARNTFTPIALIGLAILDPAVIVTGPLLLSTISTGFLILAGIQKCLGNDESAIWALNAANEVFSRLCQAVINQLVLPLSALSMLTRGVSTGLQAAKIYDYDAPIVSNQPKEDDRHDADTFISTSFAPV